MDQLNRHILRLYSGAETQPIRFGHATNLPASRSVVAIFYFATSVLYVVNSLHVRDQFIASP